MPGPGTLAIPTTFALAVGNTDTIAHLDANFVAIRDYLNPRIASSGLLANRAAAGNAGAIYYATDTGLTYLDTGAAWISIAGGVTVLDRKVATTDVNTSVVETAVYTYAVPGGTLGTSRALRLRLIGDYLNSSGGGSDLRVRLKYGATTILDTGAITVGSNANRRMVTIDAVLSALNLTNAQVSDGKFVLGDVSTVAGVVGPSANYTREDAIHATIAEDSTAAKNLVVTVLHSVSAGTISSRTHVVTTELL